MTVLRICASYRYLIRLITAWFIGQGAKCFVLMDASFLKCCLLNMLSKFDQNLFFYRFHNIRSLLEFPNTNKAICVLLILNNDKSYISRMKRIGLMPIINTFKYFYVKCVIFNTIIQLPIDHLTMCFSQLPITHHNLDDVWCLFGLCLV